MTKTRPALINHPRWGLYVVDGHGQGAEKLQGFLRFLDLRKRSERDLLNILKVEPMGTGEAS